MSPHALPVGHVQGSSEVRAELHNWCDPARTAAVAGRWFSSKPSSFAMACWLTEVMLSATGLRGRKLTQVCFPI